MNIKKFKLYQSPEMDLNGSQSLDILINLDHIVSIKPINIPTPDKVIQAYWIRLTNGKKYKAVEIPLILRDILEKNAAQFTVESNSDTMEFH